MKLPKFSVLLTLFSVAVVVAGCQSNSTKPSNPFAQSSLTVPPPATFSSQDSYLGQTSGTYIPQIPATTFPATPPPSVPASSPQSAIIPNSETTPEKATLFSTTSKESDWTPVSMTSTSQTAFQSIEAKVAATENAIFAGSESFSVGTSHVVTEIKDESATLPEPAVLYSGQYAQ